MMTDLFEKSIATLELPRVLEQLAACASTQEGKERCLALRPMTDPDDVQRAQEETSAAVEMLIKRGSPGFSGVKPVGASLHRADMGGSLNTRELLEVAAVLRCARTVQDYGAGEEKTPISHLFRALTPNRFLEETITNSIIGEDELADSASSELASIRRHIRATEAKVRDILQRILASNQSKYLQESIITIRSDRYVVPVKSEFKNAIPGLVHDVSSSGSTFFIEPMGVVKANNELRELMKFLDEAGESGTSIVTNLMDPIVSSQEGVQLEAAYDFEDYRDKVNRYVNEHSDTLAIHKLTHNIPLSEGDYEELERVLTKELGSREDYEREFGDTPFGLLVRKIAKLDHEAAMEAFSAFINDQSLNQRQIAFVHKIINHIERNGYMETAAELTKPPFDKPVSFIKLFDPKTRMALMETIHQIRENAVQIVAS